MSTNTSSGHVRLQDYVQVRESIATVVEYCHALDRRITDGDVSLKEHVELQVSQIAVALTAAQREFDKFEDGVKARFVQVNEFRDALDDLSKLQATRRELVALETIVREVQGATVLRTEMDVSLAAYEQRLTRVYDKQQEILTRKEFDGAMTGVRAAQTALGNQIGELRSRLDVGPPELRALAAVNERRQGGRDAIIDTRSLVYGVLLLLVGLAAAISPHIH